MLEDLGKKITSSLDEIATGSIISYKGENFEVKELPSEQNKEKYIITHPSGKPIHKIGKVELIKLLAGREATLVVPEIPETELGKLQKELAEIDKKLGEIAGTETPILNDEISKLKELMDESKNPKGEAYLEWAIELNKIVGNPVKFLELIKNNNLKFINTERERLEEINSEIGILKRGESTETPILSQIKSIEERYLTLDREEVFKRIAQENLDQLSKDPIGFLESQMYTLQGNIKWGEKYTGRIEAEIENIKLKQTLEQRGDEILEAIENAKTAEEMKGHMQNVVNIIQANNIKREEVEKNNPDQAIEEEKDPILEKMVEVINRVLKNGEDMEQIVKEIHPNAKVGKFRISNRDEMRSDWRKNIETVDDGRGEYAYIIYPNEQDIFVYPQNPQNWNSSGYSVMSALFDGVGSAAEQDKFESLMLPARLASAGNGKYKVLERGAIQLHGRIAVDLLDQKKLRHQAISPAPEIEEESPEEKARKERIKVLAREEEELQTQEDELTQEIKELLELIENLPDEEEDE